MSVEDACLWQWCNSVLGRQWVLGSWDCFQLVLEGQSELSLGRAFEPSYREVGEDADAAGRTMLRNFSRGLTRFRKLEAPQIGAAALFRNGKVPVHVGLWVAPGLMLHVNQTTATTLAEIGEGTDYFFSLDGFYVPV